MSEAYVISGPCRRPAGKMVLRPQDDRDGYKGRSSYLAECLGGRWSHQAGGYVMSPAAAAKFEKLYRAGFDGQVRFSRQPARFQHYDRNLRDLTAAEALRLAESAVIPMSEFNTVARRRIP